MNTVRTHRELDLWKVSMDLVIDIYTTTDGFPKDEKFGLTLQIRRAAVSICANVAEGAARGHPKEFVHFLYISLGSVSEVETQLEIAYRLNYIKETGLLKDKTDRIRKMLIGLIKNVQKNI
jgi:four helix bundle protein